MTYNQYLDEWLAIKKLELREQTLSTNTRNVNNWIRPFLGEMPISTITPLHIKSYVAKLVDKGLAPTTIKLICVLVKNSFEHAVELGIVHRNPARKVKLPSTDNTNETTIWTEEQAKKFFEYAKDVNPSFYMAYYIAYYSGARQGEILGLPWKNVKFEDNSITITQTLTNNGKTIVKNVKNQSSKRTISLPPFVMETLKKHKKLILEQKKKLGAGYVDNDLVCCTALGTPLNPTDIRKRMNKIAKQAQLLHMKFHGFRHMHATILLYKGVNIKLISSRLGHSSTKITLDTYSHVIPLMEKELISKIEDITKAH